MAGFLSAHGYDPGPTQRPFLAGGISGAIGTIPAVALLIAFGALEVEAAILGLSPILTVAIGIPVMAAAGAIYARLFGRAANTRRGAWLFGLAFGFALWAGGAVLVLPILSGGTAAAGTAAVGLFLSLLAWGATMGTLVPFVEERLDEDVETGAHHASVGPSAAAPSDAPPPPSQR